MSSEDPNPHPHRDHDPHPVSSHRDPNPHPHPEAGPETQPPPAGFCCSSPPDTASASPRPSPARRTPPPPGCTPVSPAAGRGGTPSSGSSPAESFPSGYKLVSSSLEQPLSLCSNPPSGNLFHHTLSPYSALPGGRLLRPVTPRPLQGPQTLAPPQHPAYNPYWRVFVTYEADNDKHVNEIINFVALLRHNGFDTHIDIFEQQFRSISKIDFMERYLSEDIKKEYLIIIIISPKYYETVTSSVGGLESDERTFNTVYIHKQLQNEFIQNGSKNFRFIPIVFPGAKKCHVPNWLQNTHVYEWPLHRDDILRRLMRIEKYNPPQIGSLPTIVSIPI
ncbi:hypothetical protein KUCAC02_037022 [Chaenocephalus aceratus]|nr:hypothetical protein KUCAC02_037022 [Chaenocephalus aceratus]